MHLERSGNLKDGALIGTPLSAVLVSMQSGFCTSQTGKKIGETRSSASILLAALSSDIDGTSTMDVRVLRLGGSRGELLSTTSNSLMTTGSERTNSSSPGRRDLTGIDLLLSEWQFLSVLRLLSESQCLSRSTTLQDSRTEPHFLFLRNSRLLSEFKILPKSEVHLSDSAATVSCTGFDGFVSKEKEQHDCYLI